MKRFFLALFLITLLTFSGCVGGGKKHPVVVEEGQKEEQGGFGFTEEINYTEEQNTSVEEGTTGPTYVYFFDVHSREALNVERKVADQLEITSGRVKDGRLIVIKEGAKEAVVWSVPEERYEEALSSLDEVVDYPIEYFIIPSPYPTSLETAERATSDLDVDKIIIPDYPYEGFPAEGRKVKAGDVLSLGKSKLRVLSPIPGRLPGGLGNSITFELEAPHKMLFLLDANPALCSVLFIEYGDELRGWALELPLYGRGAAYVGGNLNLLREYGADIFVVEGAPLALKKSDPYEDRAVLRFVKDILKKDIYVVWKGDVVLDATTGEVVRGGRLEGE